MLTQFTLSSLYFRDGEMIEVYENERDDKVITPRGFDMLVTVSVADCNL